MFHVHPTVTVTVVAFRNVVVKHELAAAKVLGLRGCLIVFRLARAVTNFKNGTGRIGPPARDG